MIKVERIVVGELLANSYIVHNNKEALIIDPGDESNKIINKIEKLNLIPLAVLITHHHFDHDGDLDKIKDYYKNIKVIDYKSNRDIKLNEFNFKILETFGHTMDSVSYYFEKEKILFSGDFIFKGTIGNYDYQNELSMIMSLMSFKKLPKDIKIYPGHGEDTTSKEEMDNNPFLRGI